jgi:hypothetical protein
VTFFADVKLHIAVDRAHGFQRMVNADSSGT